VTSISIVRSCDELVKESDRQDREGASEVLERRANVCFHPTQPFIGSPANGMSRPRLCKKRRTVTAISNFALRGDSLLDPSFSQHLRAEAQCALSVATKRR
jgi:hypothetical protein